MEILQRPVTGGDLFNREALLDKLTTTRKNFALVGTLFIHFKDTLEGTFRRRNMGRYLQILKAIALGNYTPTAIAKSVGIKLTSLPTYMDFRLILSMACLQSSTKRHIDRMNLLELE